MRRIFQYLKSDYPHYADTPEILPCNGDWGDVNKDVDYVPKRRGGVVGALTGEYVSPGPSGYYVLPESSSGYVGAAMFGYG